MRYSILHNTTVTQQWTAKRPDMANAVFRIVKNHGKIVTFVGLKGAIAPPWIRPCFCTMPYLLLKTLNMRSVFGQHFYHSDAF